MPIIDQIKHIESLDDWDPFTVLINWNTGSLQFIFYRELMYNDFDNQYNQLMMFFQRSFNKVSIIPLHKLKNLLLTFNHNNKLKTDIQSSKEIITTKDHFSDIIKSLEKTKEFAIENGFNESMDYYVDLDSIIYWQFSLNFLKKIDKSIVKDFKFDKLFMAQVNYNLVNIHKAGNNVPPEPYIITPILALPPLKKQKNHLEKSSIQLLLFILNKWMFKKFTDGKTSYLLEKFRDNVKPLPQNSVKSKISIEKLGKKSDGFKDIILERPSKAKKTQEVLIKAKNGNPIKESKLDKFLEKNIPKKITDTKNIIQDNFTAALDLISNNDTSNSVSNTDYNKNQNQRKNLNLKNEFDSKNTFQFTDFCRNFCSLFPNTNLSNLNPPTKCIDSLNRNKNLLDQVLEVTKPEINNNLFISNIKSIVKGQKLDRDKTACLLTHFSIVKNNIDLEEYDLKYQLFRELFI